MGPNRKKKPLIFSASREMPDTSPPAFGIATAPFLILSTRRASLSFSSLHSSPLWLTGSLGGVKRTSS